MNEKLELNPDQEYTIILNGAELVTVINKVVKMPYDEVVILVAKMTEQINQQNLKTKENG
jgi:hypothetical protein